MSNKRGQGWELGTILLLVLGVVVVVLVILGATGAFDFIFSKSDQIPGQTLQTIVAGCEIAANNNLRADYCFEFKELNKDEFVNCEDSRVQASMDSKSKGKINCDDAGIVARCIELIEDEEYDSKLNGKRVGKNETLSAEAHCDNFSANNFVEQ